MKNIAPIYDKMTYMPGVDISLMFYHIIDWNSFHSINLDFWITPVRQRVWNGIDSFFVNLFFGKNYFRTFITNLEAVNSKSWPSKQLLMANVTFEMSRFLMLNENSLVVEFSVTIPAPRAHCLSLLSTHFSNLFILNSKILKNCKNFSQPAKSVYLLLNFFV